MWFNNYFHTWRLVRIAVLLVVLVVIFLLDRRTTTAQLPTFPVSQQRR
jgi:hypothetical protein